MSSNDPLEPPPPDPGTAASKRSSLAMLGTASRFSYVGIFFGVSIVIGFAGGRYLERHWGGAPWVSLAGVLVGVATGFRELIRVARAYTREHKASE